MKNSLRGISALSIRDESDHMSKLMVICSVASRLVLSGVFMTSAIGKLLSPTGFQDFVSSFEWFVLVNQSTVLYTLAFAEIAVAVAILIQSTRFVGSISAIILLIVFSGMLMYASSNIADVPCGCFGKIIEENSLDISFIRNMVLLLVSVVVLNSPQQIENHESG